LPHHNPDLLAAYRRGMASQARDDVNLDDGRVTQTATTGVLHPEMNFGI
jgi:hypothetical protein